jgi:ribosomal protein S27AE
MIQQPGFSEAKQKTCSNCGASFTCGVSAGNEACWCYELPHVSGVTAKDWNCLCPRCLTEAIAKVSSNQDAAADRASVALSETTQVPDR